MAQSSNDRLIDLLKEIATQDPHNQILEELYTRHEQYTISGLVQDIRDDGSNTIGRWISGAVDYDEVVKRVAKKVGISEDDLSPHSETDNELLIIQHAFKTYLNKLSPSEKEEKIKAIINETGDGSSEFVRILLTGSASSLLATIQLASPVIVRQVLMRIFAYLFAVQGALTAARFAVLAIPFLNIIMGAWLIFDISGPAYRKIVPSVLNIALLRLTSV
jgi:uncharacterized protein YaaW (UPF0174 family)